MPQDARAAFAERVLQVARHPAGRASDGGHGAPWPLGQVPSASLYFRFYLSRALEAAGLGDEYVGLLHPSRELLEQSLTTWSTLVRKGRATALRSGRQTLELQ